MRTNSPVPDNLYRWVADTISTMLEKLHNPEEKQMIFENTHEPIIDADTWGRVQGRKQR